MANTNDNNTKAEFYVFSSFGIPERLYVIFLGNIKSGTISDGMYAKIGLNSTLNLSVKFHEVTKIDFPDDNSVDTLLITYCDDMEWYNFLLGMKVNNEIITVELEGED
jgi:hypothetical protein